MWKSTRNFIRTGLINGIAFCSSCFEKQCKIDRLEEEIESLKGKLKYRQRKDKEEFFGSSTPSSKKVFKSKSSDENKARQGGARPGHQGHGRKLFTAEEADEIIEQRFETTHCPECGEHLEIKETEERPIIEGEMLKPRKILFRCQVKRCPKCKKTFRKKAPVLRRHKYGTQFVSNSAVMHYIHGIPLKRVENIGGNDVIAGNLIKTFHQIAKIFKPAMEKLKEDYRQAEVKHADETGWRTDGDNGYCWLFCSNDTSIFDFRDTRSAEVVKGIMGEEKLPGVLVVDRYAGYNKVPCKIQYCYAHLLRKVQDLEKEFPGKPEVKRFVNCVAPLLARAMQLREKKMSEKQYYKKAKRLKDKIMAHMNSPGTHPAVQEIQNIFREKKDRLFHWEYNRFIPADNNYAERELRPTVVARKVSYGSQSKKGAETRSILMSILHTVGKRLKHGSLEEWIKKTLEIYIHNPDIDPYSLLPPP